MGEGTLRLSNLKADVGAELWLMKSSLDEVSRGAVEYKPSRRAEMGVALFAPKRACQK